MTDERWVNVAIRVTLIATVFQVAMVVTGHWVEAVAEQFGILGTFISLVAGAAFAFTAGVAPGTGFLGGALAGGGCALVGIALSVALGDVTLMILVLGTLVSAVAGGVGGAVVAWLV